MSDWSATQSSDALSFFLCLSPLCAPSIDLMSNYF